MKNVWLSLLTVLLSFSAVAKLTQSEQRLADRLLSGELRQVKVAAQRIYEQDISNPELIDIAAEVLLKKYPHAFANDVDTLAWVARAIGASENDRYYSVLTEVIDNTEHKKLRKHADKARDNLPQPVNEQYIAGTFPLPAKLYAKEDESEQILRIKELMLAGDLSGLKQAAREVVSKRVNNQHILDMAAEILLRHAATAQKHQVDTFAWLTNALGSSGNARYVHTLMSVEESSDFRKLRKYAEKNREKLGQAKGEQYKSGMVDEPLPDYDY
ncbi:hypothetical protein OPS25_10495 [Alteromonas ponticola]|uniref:HEAT repeat domain-containing protein n=1 Tax=Alteromonas aquimaris TaxID=2998417 RepID=A0ABT3P823_9ALTE|nr:hypothetical protein [Alteromonas aquimaris]MCW8108921.1 hypothetical protein [Alteromonas aquimaris]